MDHIRARSARDVPPARATTRSSPMLSQLISRSHAITSRRLPICLPPPARRGLRKES